MSMREIEREEAARERARMRARFGSAGWQAVYLTLAAIVGLFLFGVVNWLIHLARGR